MKVKLYSSVPTVNQIKSIRSFGIPTQGRTDGSYYCERYCNTITSAKSELYKIADRLAKNETEQKEMYKQIKKHNSLSYDAATLSII